MKLIIYNSFFLKYIYQISKALDYIHSQNIIHRDVKPENILLGYFNEVKLADFGWSYELAYNDENNNNNVLPSGVVGTLDYLAPEIIEYKEYDYKVDIWSLGVLAYELLIGKPPFESLTTQDTLIKIKNVQYTFKFNTNRQLNSKAKEFIQNLLVKEAKKRLSLNDILNHVWIYKYANKDNSYEKYFSYE